MQELEKNGGDLHRSLTAEAQQVIDQKLKHTLLPPQDVRAHMAELKRLRTKVYSVTPAEVKKVIGRRNLNKGGGFSGHRYSHMAAALQNEGARAELLTLLADVVNIVMSGRIPLPLVPYTHGGLGNIAGAKRLFVAMEVIVRLADAALQSKYIKDKGVESLFKFNVGVGVARSSRRSGIVAGEHVADAPFSCRSCVARAGRAQYVFGNRSFEVAADRGREPSRALCICVILFLQAVCGILSRGIVGGVFRWHSNWSGTLIVDCVAGGGSGVGATSANARKSHSGAQGVY